MCREVVEGGFESGFVPESSKKGRAAYFVFVCYNYGFQKEKNSWYKYGNFLIGFNCLNKLI